MADISTLFPSVKTVGTNENRPKLCCITRTSTRYIPARDPTKITSTNGSVFYYCLIAPHGIELKNDSNKWTWRMAKSAVRQEQKRNNEWRVGAYKIENEIRSFCARHASFAAACCGPRSVSSFFFSHQRKLKTRKIKSVKCRQFI